MAFRLWRDALESSHKTAKNKLVMKGLEFAVTDSARSTLQSMMGGFVSETAYQNFESEITFLSIQDEPGIHVLPVVGNLYTATRRQLSSVTSVQRDGAFGLFKLCADGIWVALPTCQPLINAQRPAGILIEDCAKVPALLYRKAFKKPQNSVQCRSGPGLLVFDCEVSVISGTKFYLAEDKGTRKLSIIPGDIAQDDNFVVAGEILFCYRQSLVDVSSE
jgi:hypothetical protein